jgi:CheY-like chemotaxis protein
VEDNPVNALVIKRLLLLAGVKKEEMLFLKNGQEAVEEVQHQRFDVIFMVFQ